MAKPNVFTRLLGRIGAFMASEWCFRIIVALLVLQALWIALTGLYPMAFDEGYHVGLIQLYSHQPSPFLHGQPVGADVFGAVARDPSYLYAYLMSFPYRLVHLFTHNQSALVIALRLLNIALFAAALPLFRRVLLKLTPSRGLVHTVLLLFVLLPITPLLAGQVNYDNMILPIIGWVLLATLQLRENIRPDMLPLRRSLVLLTVCLLASLIKYAFLPIFLAVVLYVAVVFWRSYPTRRQFIKAIAKGFFAMSRMLRVALLSLLLFAFALFLQRIGVNIVRYHTPSPDCDQVLTVQQCSAFGPWNRDYNLALQKEEAQEKTESPVQYTGDWAYGMWLRTFFAVDGPTTGYQTRRPLPVPSRSAIVLATVGVIATAVYWRQILRKYNRSAILLFVLAGILYMGSLWAEEYQAFLHTGAPVAINGRYLLLVGLPLMTLAALGFRELFVKWRSVQVGIAVAAVLCFLWGGGALTYILRSNDAWYWHNAAVRAANHAVKRTVGPLVPGNNHPYL